MRLLTLSVLAVLPVLGTSIGIDSAIQTTGPKVTITAGSATMTQSVFAASGVSSYTYENTINLTTLGAGSGYLSVYYMPDNEISGSGSASSAVQISGVDIPIFMSFQVPITLGQQFPVYMRTSAAGGAAPPAFGSSAVSLFIDAFTSSGMAVNLSLPTPNTVGAHAPEPATEGAAGAVLIWMVLRFRRKMC